MEALPNFITKLQLYFTAVVKAALHAKCQHINSGYKNSTDVICLKLYLELKT
jgi:hypothetical protein